MRTLPRLACAFLAALCVALLSTATPSGQAGSPASAQPAGPAHEAETLPIKRVVLYKNGVGYFEHVGRVRGSQSVTIGFTSAQLNDALNSLTVLDLGGGRVTGISYNSEAPLSERLSALGLPIGDAATVSQFFSALRGARLEVRAGGSTVTGRLLAVEKRVRTRADNTSQEVDELSIVGDSGDVRVVELSPAVTVRLADRDLNEQVGRYLGILASAQQQSLRRMIVSTIGSGERSLFVGYVSEVPVWKSTYRLVMPSKAGAKPLLQGWAVVDNTVGEDWTNVEMSLVAGEPQSFIQQISQPYYVRRPVIPLPSSALLTPQTYEAGLTGGAAPGGAAGVVEGVASEAMPAAAPPPLASPGHAALAFRNAATDSKKVAEAIAAMPVAAAGQELGDLFEYRIQEPVTIRKNQSALVPILSGEVAVEKVTVWSRSEKNSVPLRAVWLENTTNLTLDGGSFTVLESEAFAGEGLMSTLKPHEKRLLSYAADTAIHADARSEGGLRHVQRVRINKGTIVQVAQDQERRVYTVRNEDTVSRTVIVEHPARPGWTLAPGTPQPAESSAGYHRFRLTVDPKKTVTLTVDEVYPREVRYVVSRMTDSELMVFVQGPGVDPAIAAALKPVVEKKQAIAAVDRDLAARRAETDQIGTDQARVRENMKVLKGSAEERALTERYTRELDQQENRLEVLRRETATLEQQRAKLQAELDTLIEALTV
jgi:hypothetical protein